MLLQSLGGTPPQGEELRRVSYLLLRYSTVEIGVDDSPEGDLVYFYGGQSAQCGFESFTGTFLQFTTGFLLLLAKFVSANHCRSPPPAT